MSTASDRRPAAGSRPVVGTMIGDPAGIGPEVAVKALASGRVHDVSVPVLLGSAAAVERALKFTGLNARVRVMQQFEKPSDDPAIIDVIDTGALPEGVLPLGEDTEAAGHASAQWLDELDALARDGSFAATIMGPISTGSLKMAGKIDKVISPTPGESYLVLLTGPLRVAHLTDHMPLRQVIDVISSDLVASALEQLNDAMTSWGIVRPRIAVAGLNPHAAGDEDRDVIAPGVELARSKGINVEGPIPPDSVFRQCIEGRYDMVLAMFHDQGHIAVKTWGFSGNCVIMMGPPYLHMSVAHGTAYDIAGKGTADAEMMLSAMLTAGRLASGGGFEEARESSDEH
ncbi:MAG: 4-hydroxythreonine-4-phosphate dehydrogenase PdxA [Alteraurantiacibacter sp. bin_em_oilr2.035]|nr:4-hydroxythreonine-4-phosphate dehydrogenase PdxA [Aurantiacibacter atlanticus]MDF1834362.1 4-hydroxythreonine-4-phosphate dehydrogenase PdxA [Alteraurantiacibacter sp. bin_em_oilr2.035]